jgi:hypothetical protein
MKWIYLAARGFVFLCMPLFLIGGLWAGDVVFLAVVALAITASRWPRGSSRSNLYFPTLCALGSFVWFLLTTLAQFDAVLDGLSYNVFRPITEWGCTISLGIISIELVLLVFCDPMQKERL